MRETERKPAESCAVMAAEDGDVAILAECAEFDPVAPLVVAFDGDTLVITQLGHELVRVPGIDDGSASLVEEASSVSVISVAGAGTPEETYAVNANTTVEKRKGR